MIYIFLADGFEETEALAPLDILRRANLDVKTVGVTGEVAEGAHNIKVFADISLDEVKKEDIDAVILPGGLGGTENLDKSEKVKELIEYADKNKKLVCAICAAPSILGEMRLLKDKEATCYPGFEEFFQGGKYTKESVCVCKNFITADGMGSAYKFAFKILEELSLKEEAEKIKEQIQY